MTFWKLEFWNSSGDYKGWELIPLNNFSYSTEGNKFGKVKVHMCTVCMSSTQLTKVKVKLLAFVKQTAP